MHKMAKSPSTGKSFRVSGAAAADNNSIKVRMMEMAAFFIGSVVLRNSQG